MEENCLLIVIQHPQIVLIMVILMMFVIICFSLKYASRKHVALKHHPHHMAMKSIIYSVLCVVLILKYPWWHVVNVK